MDEKEQKPDLSQSATQEDKPKIQITVNFEGCTATFAIRKNTKFEKIFSAAEKQFKVQTKTLRFTFDGDRIREQQTPAEVGMDDGDQIDAHVEQQGGS